jgi:hypothetical protein
VAVWTRPAAEDAAAPALAFRAARAVVTVPLALLQAGAVGFDPPLPDWKRAAVAGLGAGQAAKVRTKLGQLQPFIAAAVSPRECRGQLGPVGPT